MRILGKGTSGNYASLCYPALFNYDSCHTFFLFHGPCRVGVASFEVARVSASNDTPFFIGSNFKKQGSQKCSISLLWYFSLFRLWMWTISYTSITLILRIESKNNIITNIYLKNSFIYNISMGED